MDEYQTCIAKFLAEHTSLIKFERNENLFLHLNSDYFQEWDDHAPRGMPLYNISRYYNSGNSRPQNFLGPQDELPSLPDRLIVTQNASRGETNGEPSSMRFNFDDEEDEYGDYPVEEVYVRADRAGGNRRSRNQQIVFDVRPDWDN